MLKPYLTPTLRLSSTLLFFLILPLALSGLNPLPVFLALGVLGYFLPQKDD
jgi:hypothetical protein